VFLAGLLGNGQFGDQLQPLCLPPAQGGTGLADFQVAQPGFLKEFQGNGNSGLIFKERNRFVDAEFEDVEDRVVPVLNFQDGIAPAVTAALFAGNVGGREEIHFHFDGTLTLAGRAASFTGIVGKIRLIKSPGLGERKGGEKVSKMIHQGDVSGYSRA